MNWKASATEATKSSSRIVVMSGFCGSGSGARDCDPWRDVPPENFTIAGSRKFPREVHDSWRLVGREALAAIVEELIRGGRGTVAKDGVGDDQPLVRAYLFTDARAVG